MGDVQLSLDHKHIAMEQIRCAEPHIEAIIAACKAALPNLYKKATERVRMEGATYEEHLKVDIPEKKLTKGLIAIAADRLKKTPGLEALSLIEKRGEYDNAYGQYVKTCDLIIRYYHASYNVEYVNSE